VNIEEMIAAIFRRELEALHRTDGWVDQFRSPLRMPGQKSSIRHCHLVRKRLEEKKDGAYISPDGKQFFLTQSALEEECRGAPRNDTVQLAKTAPVADPDEVDEDYEGMMRLIRGGRQ
jgi:hypothetical protein